MKIRIQSVETKFSASFWIIAASCVCLLIQLYAIPHKSTTLMSLANRVMLVLWLGIVSFSICIKLSSFTKEITNFLLLLVFSILSLIASLLQSPQYAGENITALMNYLVLPAMLLYAAVYEIDEKAKTLFLITNLGVSLLFMYLSESNMAYRVEGRYYTFGGNELTLGYPNPNQAAMYLYICAVNIFIGFFYFRNSVLKILHAVDFFYIVWLLEKTKARTALLLIVVFVVMAVCAAIRRIPKIWISITVLVPFVYALATQAIYPLLKDVTFLGESLFNGREALFDRYFKDLNVFSFIFGDFSKYKFANMHNAYVSIAATAGIIALICYVLMMKNNIEANYKNGLKNRYERVAFTGFLCIILYSSTEAAGLLGGTNFAFMAFSIYMLFAKPYVQVLDNPKGDKT